MASFRKKGKGWECRISYAGGVLSRSGRSRREALSRAEALKRELDSGVTADAAKFTLATFLRHWLAQHKKKIWINTRVRYEQSGRLHVIPYLGEKGLSRLVPTNLEKLYSDLLVGGRRLAASGGLHPRTIKHVHEMLHKALGDAMKWQLIPRNPADAVSLPKLQRRPVTPPHCRRRSKTERSRSLVSL